MKEAFAWIGGTVLALAVTVGLLIGGQRLGWWMKTYDVNKGAQVYQQGYGAQTAYAEQLNRLMAEVANIEVQEASAQTPKDEINALESQRTAVVTQACDIYSRITHPTTAASQFAAQNCGGQ